MKTTHIDITQEKTLEEKINLVISMLLTHKQSMKSYYDDFTDDEHNVLITSDEHQTLSDSLTKFYQKHNI